MCGGIRWSREVNLRQAAVERERSLRAELDRDPLPAFPLRPEYASDRDVLVRGGQSSKETLSKNAEMTRRRTDDRVLAVSARLARGGDVSGMLRRFPMPQKRIKSVYVGAVREAGLGVIASLAEPHYSILLPRVSVEDANIWLRVLEALFGNESPSEA